MIGAILAEVFSEPGKPSEIADTATTDEVLQSMFTENTGRHMLDSGGAYGRAWEKNQGVDMVDTPEMNVEWRVYDASKYSKKPEGELEVEVMATVSSFHWLRARLEYSPEWDRAFQMFADSPGNENSYWLELMEEFAHGVSEASGGLSRADFNPVTVNTYNHESALSQVLQWTGFESPDDEYVVLLQVHGGCDVRGGYTAPRAFVIAGHDGVYSMFDDSRMSLYCHGSKPNGNPDQLDMEGQSIGETFEPCRAMWDSDNAGYSFYDAGCYETPVDDPFEAPVERGTEGKRGVLVIDEDNNRAFCPCCGSGELELYGMIDC